MLITMRMILGLTLTAVALAMALFGVWRWQLRHIRPTAGPGALLSIAGAIWILINLLEMLSPDTTSAIFWHKAQFIPMAAVPTLWLYMALQFTGLEHRLTRRRLGMLIVLVIIFLGAAMTSGSHDLFLVNPQVNRWRDMMDVSWQPGILLVFFYIIGYLQILTGTYLLTQKLLHSRGFRWQGSMVMLGVLLAVGANINDWAHVIDTPIKLTPLALGIAVPLFVVTLVRARRADIVPIARATIIQSMRDPMLVLDFENRIIDLNAAAETIFGHPLDECLGQIITEAWPEWAADFQDLLAVSTDGSAEFRLGAGAQARIFDVRVSELHDWRGMRLSRAIMFRDMTERIRADEALRASEERYRLHFTHVNDVIYSVDADLTFITVTPSVERVIGIKPEALIGRSLEDFTAFLAPEAAEQALSAARRVLAGERIEGTLFEVQTPEGRRVILEISASPVIQEGAVVAAINVARDITERVLFEEQLQASLEEKEMLLKEIHHRVKNNLQIISSLLSLQSSAQENAQVQALFRDSQSRVQSMALIHERLYRSDISAQVEFNAYLEDLVTSIAETYRRGTQAVTCEVVADPIPLDLDTAIPCGLIVTELVSNALKHAFPDGQGGRIRVQFAQEGPGQDYHLTIEDTGAGLPDNFDLRRAQSLGLQLVHSLGRQLGGAVTTHRLPQGTRFDVRFPAHAERGR
ncbi:MAG: hypothetical protein Kow0077_32400 [Anaerolineae bacterium]